jgi:hypothetical protein
MRKNLFVGRNYIDLSKNVIDSERQKMKSEEMCLTDLIGMDVSLTEDPCKSKRP